MRTLQFGILIGLPLAFVAACGETSPSIHGNSPASTPRPVPTRTPLTSPVAAGALLPPAGSIYFGVYDDLTGLNGGETPADITTLEGSLGRTVALHMEYQAFSTLFSDALVKNDFEDGRLPVSSWNCGATDAAIVAGTDDEVIRARADSIKAYGWPVFVRFFWDPNIPATYLGRGACYDPVNDLANDVFSPTEYIAAWQHVHQIFAQESATNAVWLWSVDSFGTNPLPYYPGSANVDWVGIDAYDTDSGSFSSTFASSYTTLSTLDKPIMITETGALAPVQTTFFANAASTLQTQFPLVQGFVYYDGIFYDPANDPQDQDWRVSTGAFPTFSTFANAAYMSGSYYGP